MNQPCLHVLSFFPLDGKPLLNVAVYMQRYKQRSVSTRVFCQKLYFHPKVKIAASVQTVGRSRSHTHISSASPTEGRTGVTCARLELL